MQNVDPDFHYQACVRQSDTLGGIAFRGLALVCAVGAIAGLIDMLVTIPLNERLNGSVLFYSVPALVALAAAFRFRTIDKHGTYAGMLAFLLSSLAHAGNLWLASLGDVNQIIQVWMAFVRVGLFALYAIMMVAGLFMLATSDMLARDLRRHFNHF